MSVLSRVFAFRRGRFLETCLGRTPCRTEVEERWIDLSSGGRLYAHLHSPEGDGPFPGVIIVPGGGSPGTDYDTAGPHPRAKDMAAMGFSVLHYDPSGRGKSDGVEDHWGPAAQAELCEVVRHALLEPRMDPDRLGIVSFSIGIITASGALARHAIPEVRYLFDWEGPSNRRVATRDDTHPPLAAFPTSDEAFWREREACRFVPDIHCAYFRYQAEVDHVQGRNLEHAVELVNLATRGKARWTRINDNPRNLILDPARLNQYRFVLERENHYGRFLGFLLDVLAEVDAEAGRGRSAHDA